MIFAGSAVAVLQFLLHCAMPFLLRHVMPFLPHRVNVGPPSAIHVPGTT